MRLRTRVLFGLIIFLMVAGVAEIMAYLKARQLVSYNIGFNPLVTDESHNDYQLRHHPRLGWTPAPEQVDAVGSRPIPAFHDPLTSTACVALYGDSFTEGAGVDHEQAWSNVLSVLLNCRVANFGVSGYGTDQAYLSFMDNHKDPARLVILGFLTENIMRNVNQLRNLISKSTACLLKPRFILTGQGELHLVPIPPLTEADYNQLWQDPERLLPRDFFVPGGPSHYQKMRFPYTYRIIKAFPIIYNNLLLKRPTFFDFYQAGHPSRAIEVTVGIMKEFCREARLRNKQPLVLIIPTHFDLAHYRRTGVWVYQPLIDILAKQGVEFLDAGPLFVRYLGEAKLETLYSPAIQNHLNEAGNRLLAKIVYDYITQKDLLKKHGQLSQVKVKPVAELPE